MAAMRRAATATFILIFFSSFFCEDLSEWGDLIQLIQDGVQDGADIGIDIAAKMTKRMPKRCRFQIKRERK